MQADSSLSIQFSCVCALTLSLSLYLSSSLLVSAFYRPIHHPIVLSSALRHNADRLARTQLLQQ